eukprot:641780_1
MAASRYKHLMNILGMSCGAFGEMLNATEDSIAKLSGLSGSQLIFGRYMFQLMVGIIWWFILKYFYSKHELGNWYGNTPHISKIWIYGTLQFINILCFWYGIRFVPIGISYCIMATGDALTFYIAYIYFKEPLFKTFPMSVSLRILSLLLLLQKPTIVFEYFMRDINTEVSELHVGGLLLVSIAAIAWSLSNVTLKATAESNHMVMDTNNNIQRVVNQEGDGAHFLQLEITHALQTLVFWIPFMTILNSWTIKDTFIGSVGNMNENWNYNLHSFGTLCAIGVVGFGADVLTIMAFQFGDVSKVIWAQRMDVVCAYVYQIWLFKEAPNAFEICGAILMMIAAFLPMFEELSGYCSERHHNDDSIDELEANSNEMIHINSTILNGNAPSDSSDNESIDSLDNQSAIASMQKTCHQMCKDVVDIRRNLGYDSVLFVALALGVLMVGLCGFICIVIILAILEWQYWLDFGD